MRAVGVVGAGTMGAGIAQVAALAGYDAYLHDPFPEALERGLERARGGFAKGAERGRWSADEAGAAERRLHAATELEALSPCGLVIEAAPEKLELKRELFARVPEICGLDVVLATNTSSLPVTAMASASPRPENVIGMHFFNPAPLMQLLEVVAGSESSEAALETGRMVGERMGKRVIIAADGPGFLANRCARPFGMEALKLLGEAVADHATIDRVVRLGGGFRMGPFELMDLVGIDVGFEVSKSFYEQSFHEPRWRPSQIQARMVQAGRFGRKSGRGYYDYSGDTHRPDDPQVASGGDAALGPVSITGEGRLAEELRELAAGAGVAVRPPGEQVELSIDAGLGEREDDVPEAPVCVLCAAGSLAELDRVGGAVGFHALAPLAESRLVELTRTGLSGDAAADYAERFFRALGKHVEWVGDAPGLVLGRIVSQLVNEASFAVTQGVGSAADVDIALRLGFNYPRGPLEWADAIGLDQVLATLDGLWEELREERYRAAPLLRRKVAEARLGRSTGEGFFKYEEEDPS